MLRARCLPTSQQHNTLLVRTKSLSKISESHFFVRVPLAPKSAPQQPVLRGAVTRAEEQRPGQTARTGASVANHWFIAIFSEEKREERSGRKRTGGRERIERGESMGREDGEKLIVKNKLCHLNEKHDTCTHTNNYWC